jgi:DNA-binding NarL/FixJ family response regulator
VTAARERPGLRVVVADDEALVRTGLRMILEAEEDIDVVGEAADGEAAVSAVRRLRPDLVLMDVHMPLMGGLAATRRIAELGLVTRVVMLTTFDLDEYVFDALDAGASGFLLKNASAEQLVASIRLVATGEALLAPTITRRLIRRFGRQRTRRSPAGGAVSSLSARELEVLKLMARGLSNAEVAEALHLGLATVKSHVAATLEKLGLRDRVQAVVLAHRLGLVEDDA